MFLVVSLELCGSIAGRVIAISFSSGALRIDRTDYRHPNISVRASGRGQAIVGTKPAKLQNLIVVSSTAAMASGLCASAIALGPALAEIDVW